MPRFSGLLAALAALLAAVVEAHILCTDDSTCAATLREGSKCVQGKCSNPFAGGCLRRYLGAANASNHTGKWKKRTCNSHDSASDVESGLICSPSTLDYPEIRIASQNWETAMFTAWIFQIFLSEVLDVPVSIETSAHDGNLNFYDLENSFDYGAIGYDYDALETAFEVSDCRTVVSGEKASSSADEGQEYRSCAHFIPEVWNGQATAWREIERRGIIESPAGSGAVGRLGWFIPRFAAEKDDTLLEFLGIQGEDNREKVARTFKRPTTWGEYCDEVAPSECAAAGDGGEGGAAASRRPADEDEAGRYFVPGSYSGHFRATDKNDCGGGASKSNSSSDNSMTNTCTGHIVDIPCDWSTYATPQAHWTGIPVESDGPLEPNGAYSYSSLIEIYQAANATQSPVLFYWWKPHALYQDFLDTKAEMLNVQLTPPSQDCVASRVSPADRCSDNFADRVGNPSGSCDGEAHSLVKLIVKNLLTDTYAQEEARRSPGYEFLRGTAISELQLGEILTYWSSRGVDKWNYDPREATCRWVAENLDYLNVFVPRYYPRKVVERALSPVWAAALVTGCVVTALTLFTSAAVYHFRKHQAIRFAQLPFLRMILVGLLMTSIGAVVFSATEIEPSQVSCIAGTWLMILGYNFALVPLMVKVATINKMARESSGFRRVTVNRQHLYLAVAAVSAVAVIFLVCWTIVDPVARQLDLDLTANEDEDGATIVNASTYCGSESSIWFNIALGWQFVLLLAASVLAFQNRQVREEFNESRTLAFMIYSHLLLSILLVLTQAVEGSFSPQLLAGYRCLLYGLDALVTLVVYFAPKFLNIYQKDELQNPGLRSTIPNSLNSLAAPRSSMAHGKVDISRVSGVYLDTTNSTYGSSPDHNGDGVEETTNSSDKQQQEPHHTSLLSEVVEGEEESPEHSAMIDC